jgi:hypothetical protein
MILFMEDCIIVCGHQCFEPDKGRPLIDELNAASNCDVSCQQRTVCIQRRTLSLFQGGCRGRCDPGASVDVYLGSTLHSLNGIESFIDLEKFIVEKLEYSEACSLEESID